MKDLKNNTKEKFIKEIQNIERYQEDDKISRPKNFNDFIGQNTAKKNLNIFITSAKKRKDALEHVLFYGPPGLGKTSLAYIIANEMESNITITSAATISKSADIVAILSRIKKNDIIFMDEIHRLPTKLQEILYPAMEDFRIDIVIGNGVSARVVSIKLPKFTLIAATTKESNISKPMLDRFGIPITLDFYSNTEIIYLIKSSTTKFNLEINEDAIALLANCSRGTPRIALRLLRRIYDFAQYRSTNNISLSFIEDVFANLQISNIGLNDVDHKYLKFIFDHYTFTPVGLNTISSALAIEKDNIEITIEPYLIKIGFINKTPKGRILTDKAIEYIEKI